MRNTVENAVVVTSFASIGAENEVKFGDTFTQLKEGVQIVVFTTNYKVVDNKFYDSSSESSSPKNLLVEATIYIDGKVVSSGFLRINSALKNCELNKKYEVKTIKDSFQSGEETKIFNKVVQITEIE